MGQVYRHKNTSVTLINYHFVWCPRRRRKVLKGLVEQRLKALIHEACQDSDLIVCPDIAINQHHQRDR